MIQSRIHDIKVKEGILKVCRLTPHGQEKWEELGKINKADNAKEAFYVHEVGTNGCETEISITVKRPGVYSLSDRFNVHILVGESGGVFRLAGAIKAGSLAGSISFFDCVDLTLEDGVCFISKDPNCYLVHGGYVFRAMDNKFLGYISKDKGFVSVNIGLSVVGNVGKIYYDKGNGEYVYENDYYSEGCVYVGIPKWVKPGLEFFLIGMGLVKIKSINGNKITDSRMNDHDLVYFLNNAYCYCKQIHVDGGLC